jgi:1-deoxy-D-xylulose-5-phosphate reductoisomerase
LINVTVLGSTGSIGVNTLDVLSRHRDKYNIVALTANTDVDLLYAQCLHHEPAFAVMADEASAEGLQSRLKKERSGICVLAGNDGLNRVASMENVDYVMAAIVGAAGLMPTLSAVRAGKRVLLANKESLVMSGKIFIEELAANHAELLPIDSEHNAIFQCMPGNYQTGERPDGIRRILLTASGGPFRNRKPETLENVTPEEACNHPNWKMGPKISVDSATMMNKGLEVIEACWLFGVKPDDIEVVIHKQSIIHSMVEYIDGSVLAQMGNPDMRTPIANALAWPERIDSAVDRLNLYEIGQLDFEPVDNQRFPCLSLAYEAIRTGGTGPAVLNAANEVAVEAFLSRSIRYTNIHDVIEKTLASTDIKEVNDLNDVIEADRAARDFALHYIKDNPLRLAQ